MNEAKKDIPTAYLYCVRVRTLDEHYSYGAPFIARDDKQAAELVSRSLSAAVKEQKQEIDYERGDLFCIGSYCLWSEDAQNPITKRDLRRGSNLVCNCKSLIVEEVIVNE